MFVKLFGDDATYASLAAASARLRLADNRCPDGIRPALFVCSVSGGAFGPLGRKSRLIDHDRSHFRAAASQKPRIELSFDVI